MDDPRLAVIFHRQSLKRGLAVALIAALRKSDLSIAEIATRTGHSEKSILSYIDSLIDGTALSLDMPSDILRAMGATLEWVVVDDARAVAPEEPK